MKKTKISSIIILAVTLLVLLSSCYDPPHVIEISLFEGIVHHASNDMNESDFCDVYGEYFSEEPYIPCEGETGYYSEIRKIISPLGDLDNIDIKYEEKNEYIYYYFTNNNEKVYVGYILSTGYIYIYGIE